MATLPQRPHPQRILEGEKGPRRDAAIVNAAVGLRAGIAEGFVEGVERAVESVDSGKAAEVLERVVKRSQELAGG